jgi:hypothetical protein
VEATQRAGQGIMPDVLHLSQEDVREAKERVRAAARVKETWRAWRDGELTVSALRVALVEAWIPSRAPSLYLSPNEWTRMFRAAGYVTDTPSAHAKPPTGPLELFRGSPESEMGRGMAWTENRELAEIFAATRGSRSGGSGAVWRLAVPPHHVLARFAKSQEAEVVVSSFWLSRWASPELVSTGHLPDALG